MNQVPETAKMTPLTKPSTYSGDRTWTNFRNGYGVEHWNHKPTRQIYAGQFLRDCLHNFGCYQWTIKNEKYIYQGKFYANNLDGYGTLSYPNGKVYEGLFLLNKRYGPGVLTYENGTQDVGLWLSDQLVRLNQSLIDYKVPALANTISGKAFLLQYKHIVPVTRPETETDVLTHNLKGDHLIDTSQFYSEYVRNRNSLFFNQNLYDEYYFIDPSHLIIEAYDEGADTEIITQINVTDLLAWNNEPLSISIMKHAFLNRNYEKLLSFPIANILVSPRIVFNDPGIQELACVDFLTGCCFNEASTIKKLIFTHDLYIDLTDNLGNSGLFYAATYDQINAIKTLVNYGANVDQLNDECLTVLLLLILRYISCNEDVTDWELGFLRKPDENENSEIREWRPIVNDLVETREQKDGEPRRNSQKYIFDLQCVHPPKSKSKGKRKKKAQKKEKKSKKVKIGQENEEEKIDPEKQKLLKLIFNTIVVILHSGADTNFGVVPFPPLILSLFTNNKDILFELITHGADCNITTSYNDGSLTPLHVLVSLPVSPEIILITQILLENGANPNSRTNEQHWPEEKEILLGETEMKDFGKTPLHILCIRYDFETDINNNFRQLLTLLVKKGANLNDLYLGHNSLTLAILRGNTDLIRSILDTGKVNPNKKLANNMGVPLTVLILKRYKKLLSLDMCENVFNVLLEYLANPFKIIPNFNVNAIEFCVVENAIGETGKKKKKPKKKSKKKGHEQVIELLYQTAERTLLKHIQGQVVKALYEYKFECAIDDPIFDETVKFLDLQEAASVLQILLTEKKIIANKFLCYELLCYVKKKMPKAKRKKEKKTKKSKEPPPPTLEELTASLKFDTIVTKKSNPFKLYLPEVDTNVLKYAVCFECYQQFDKELVLCPKCELIYFCSQQCNFTNNKKNSRHKCKMLFYNSELIKQRERIDSGEVIIRKFAGFKEYRNDMIAYTPDYFNKLKFTDDMDAADFANQYQQFKHKQGAILQHSIVDLGLCVDDFLKSGSRKSRKDGGSKSKSRDKSSTDKRGRKHRKGDESDSPSKKGKRAKDGSSKSPKRTGKKSDRSDKSTRKGKKGKRGHRSRSSSESRRGKKTGNKGRSKSLGKSPTKKGRKGDRSTSRDKGDRSKSRDKGDRSKSRDKGDRSKSRDKGERRGKGGDRDRSILPGRKGMDGKICTSLGDGLMKDDLRKLIAAFNDDDIMKFLSMFVPYCVLVNGQLYYKFEKIFYKFTYSSN